MTGPKATARDVRTIRHWRIDSVYLFDAQRLLAEQQACGVKTGMAAGVREAQWQAAEIYPTPTCDALGLNEHQRRLLSLFTS